MQLFSMDLGSAVAYIKEKKQEKTPIVVNGENVLKFLSQKGGIAVQMDKFQADDKQDELKEELRKKTLSTMNSGGVLCLDFVSPIRENLKGLIELSSPENFPLKDVLTKGWLQGQQDPKIPMIRDDDNFNHDNTPLFVREQAVAIITDLKTEEEAKVYFENKVPLDMCEFVVVK